MPPDTGTYYHAAYIVAAVLYSGYVVTLWRRYRKVRDRLRAAGTPAENTGDDRG